MIESKPPSVGDRSLVVEYLKLLANEQSLETKKEKVYFELDGSYSWEELSSHVARETPLGERYLKTLTDAAARANLTLVEFLSPDKKQ